MNEFELQHLPEAYRPLSSAHLPRLPCQLPSILRENSETRRAYVPLTTDAKKEGAA